jgi:hypothetical protein
MATTYDKGDLIRLTGNFTVATVATDPTVVTLIIRLGDGTITKLTYGSSSITKVSVGVYRYDYSATKVGDVYFSWIGTAPAQAVEQGSFFVKDDTGVTL